MPFSLPTRSALTLTCAVALAAAMGATGATGYAAVVDEPVSVSSTRATVALDAVGSYDTGVFDASAAEIVEYYGAAKRLLVVNAAEAKVEVLDASDPAAPAKLFDLQTTGLTAADGSVIPAEAVANSVAVRSDGLGVVAVESSPGTELGWLVFFDADGDGSALGAVRVGALPDMVTITPDGARAVVANEGEPADDYLVDPVGSVAVVDLARKVKAVGQDAVQIAGFGAFEEGGPKTLPAGIRIFGGREDAGTGTPEYPVSENLEPEYVAVDGRSRRAFVTLQEANGIAVVNLRSARVARILPLGTVDRRTVPMDASDRDDQINITTWPVKSFRMPDALSTYEVAGETYLVAAEEGDSRDWDGYSEVARVKDLGADGLAPVCPDYETGSSLTLEELLADEHLGRLNVTTADGLDTGAGCYADLYTFGGRGFSIWTDDGQLMFHSGAQFERKLAAAAPGFFNSNHTESNFEGRSDDKGPEPEGLTLGRVGGRTYAFIGLERVGGVMVYDITRPTRPRFMTYLNNRDFAFSGEGTASGDLGPEGLEFIPRATSPLNRPMIAVGNEVSGSTALYRLRKAGGRG